MNQRLLHFPDDRSVPVTTISTWCDPRGVQRPHIGVMAHLDLSDDEAAAPIKGPYATIDNDPPRRDLPILKDLCRAAPDQGDSQCLC
jgi:hypothetical protein